MVELSVKGELDKTYNVSLYGELNRHEEDSYNIKLIKQLIGAMHVKLMLVKETKGKETRNVVVIAQQ